MKGDTIFFRIIILTIKNFMEWLDEYVMQRAEYLWSHGY